MSIWTTTLLSIVRFVVVVLPFRASSWCRIGRVGITLLILFFLAVAFNVFFLIERVNLDNDRQNSTASVVLDFKNNPSTRRVYFWAYQILATSKRMRGDLPRDKTTRKKN